MGSGAIDGEDAWSDIDLALRLADGLEPDDVGESNEPPPARSLAPGGLDHGVRDQAITLACLRHELPTHHGRGVDDLPAALRQTLAETLVRELDRHELRRAFAASIAALLDEAQQVDPDREQRLRETVRELAHTVT